jgi:hypothetical protein
MRRYYPDLSSRFSCAYRSTLVAFFLFWAPELGACEERDPVSFSGYLDASIAHDFNHLPTRYRPYTTQPYYTDEASLNLGYVDATLDRGVYHGRIAAQYGSSVVANYAGEQDEFFRYIQEAFLGADVTDKLRIDGGIFFSHIGMENWISRDNYTPSRSLIADYSPYYQSGIRAIYTFSEDLFAAIHLIRGWQNMTNEKDPGVGTQLSYALTKRVSLIHNTCFLNYHGSRFFNDFILKTQITSDFGILASYDFGLQERRDETTATWRGWAIVPHYTINNSISIAGRVEQYVDPHQVIIQSLSGYSVNTTGLSANVDVTLYAGLVWRNEYRAFVSTRDIFPRREGFSASDSFVMSSLQYTIR